MGPAQRRELPERYGNWNSVYQGFARWEEQGIGAAMHEYFVEEPDMESVLLDTTVIRAHLCAAGGSKKTGVKQNNPWRPVGTRLQHEDPYVGRCPWQSPTLPFERWRAA